MATHTKRSGLTGQRSVRKVDGALIASWLITGLFTVIALLTLSTIDDPSLSVIPRVLGSFLTTLTAVLYVVLQQRRLSGPRTQSMIILAALVVVGGLVLVRFDVWTPVAFSVVAAMLVAGRRTAILVGVVVYLIAAALLVPVSNSTETYLGILAVTAVAVIILYIFTRIALSLREARASREAHALAQVDEERLRISRDLHDLMGRTLVAASLRNQVALQLLDVDVERARDQLNEVQSVLAQGQAQLRGLVSGPIVADLPDELNSARALCERVGVQLDVRADPIKDSEASELAARVLRESITNMLKHSSPRACQVRVSVADRTMTMTVTNDGLNGADRVPTFEASATPEQAPRSGEAGSGLADLRGRLAGRGGSLLAEPVDHNRFQVTMILPLQQETEAAPTASIGTSRTSGRK